jgi:hypothetical protein
VAADNATAYVRTEAFAKSVARLEIHRRRGSAAFPVRHQRTATAHAMPSVVVWKRIIASR